MLELVGHWDISLYGPDGSLKDYRRGKNVITTNGKELLAAYLASAAVSATRNPFYQIAIGTSTNAESASDTALGAEVARAAGTASYTSGAIYGVVATFAAGVGTGAIVEYGLLNSSSAGTLFSRDVEDVINKGALDILTVSTEVTLA